MLQTIKGCLTWICRIKLPNTFIKFIRSLKCLTVNLRPLETKIEKLLRPQHTNIYIVSAALVFMQYPNICCPRGFYTFLNCHQGTKVSPFYLWRNACIQFSWRTEVSRLPYVLIKFKRLNAHIISLDTLWLVIYSLT